jgi:hypothetical protein
MISVTPTNDPTTAPPMTSLGGLCMAVLTGIGVVASVAPVVGVGAHRRKAVDGPWITGTPSDDADSNPTDICSANDLGIRSAFGSKAGMWNARCALRSTTRLSSWDKGGSADQACN